MKTCSAALLSLFSLSNANFLLDPSLDELSWDTVRLRSYTNCNLDLLPGFSQFFKEEGIQYEDLQIQGHDDAPTLALMKGTEVIDEFYVGLYDTQGMHNLMAKLGLKRNKEMTVEKLQKEMELAKAFSQKGDL